MNLKTLNWLAAGANGAVGVALGIYFLVKKGTVNFNTDLYNLHIALNADNPEDSVITATKAVNVTDLALKILVLVYFAFTVFFHVLYATDAFGTGAYSRAIFNQNNYFRWIEYAISSTIMTFLVAIVCGVKELNTVILLLVMNIGMILCGQIVEAAGGPNANNIRIIGTLIGWILLLGIFGVLFKTFFMTLQDGKDNDFKIPTFVYFVIFPLFFWYAMFGAVSLYQAFGNRKDVQRYIRCEKLYILLSFLSKINLGIFVGYGLTRPKAETN